MNRQLIDCISVMLETTLNVDSQVINLKGFDISEIDMNLRSKIAGTRSPLEVTLSSTMTENLKKQEDQKRIFCFTDSFGVDYASILFREDETDRIFQIGPVFLNDLKNPDFVPDILSKNKMTPDFTVPLTEYYYHLPFVNQPTYIAVINGINICTKCGRTSNWPINPCKEDKPHKIIAGTSGPICSRCGRTSNWPINPCK